MLLKIQIVVITIEMEQRESNNKKSSNKYNNN